MVFDRFPLAGRKREKPFAVLVAHHARVSERRKPSGRISFVGGGRLAPDHVPGQLFAEFRGLFVLDGTHDEAGRAGKVALALGILDGDPRLFEDVLVMDGFLRIRDPAESRLVQDHDAGKIVLTGLNLLEEAHRSRTLLEGGPGDPFILEFFDDLVAFFQAVFTKKLPLIRDGHFLHVGGTPQI